MIMAEHGFLLLTRVSQTSNRNRYDNADEPVRLGLNSGVVGPSVAPSVSPELVRSDGSRV
jgi:hypothetical protein